MNIKSVILSVVLCMGATAANAQGLGDLLKGLGNGSDIGSTISNVIEGVFTKTDLNVEDLAGVYVSDGPAVTFKSDNFLQKAGGIAGAAAVETKLNPYYEQYGLNGMPLTIDSDANFTLTLMRMKLTGTIEKIGEGDGTFRFKLMVGGKMKIGEFTAYVEKSGNNLNLMFDATKLKELISTVASFTGGTMVKTLASILDSYEGMCVGFKMKYTGAPDSSGASVSSGSDSTSGSAASSTDAGASQTPSNGNSEAVSNGVNALRDLLNKKKK